MKAAQTAKSPRVLVIDVGGTNVKMLATGQKNEPAKVSIWSRHMTPAQDGPPGQKIGPRLEVRVCVARLPWPRY